MSNTLPPLRPLQAAAKSYFEDPGHAKGYLALRMRLGKTRVALELVDPEEITLVITPVTVGYHIVEEVKTWRGDLRAQYLRKASDRWDKVSNVVVVPWSMVVRLAKAGALPRPDYLIVDEAHYAKTLKAQRTKVVRVLVKDAKRVLALTGTPVPNRPIELFPLLNAMGADFARKQMDYGIEFCAGRPSPWHRGWDFSGASNLDVLREKLKGWMFHSQGGYVPPIPTVLAISARITAEEEAAIADLEDEYGSDPTEWDNPVIPFEMLSLFRRWAGEGKVEAAVPHIEDCLESMEKVVVFAWHQNVIEDMAAALESYGVVTVSGATPAEQRKANISAFQNSKDIRVFIGNIQAAGEGVDLSAATHAVFVEQDWTPGRVDQAAARIETADMSRIVSLDFIVRRGGIDEKLMASLAHKRGIISQTLNEDFIDE
jgi:SWI/SNF-related matrix-associated actin-dependent regulator 1 of chromatin subfamily A